MLIRHWPAPLKKTWHPARSLAGRVQEPEAPPPMMPRILTPTVTVLAVTLFAMQTVWFEAPRKRIGVEMLPALAAPTCRTATVNAAAPARKMLKILMVCLPFGGTRRL